MARPDVKPQKNRTTDEERGATLVEFGLIASILIMLLLGSITLGIAFHRNMTISGSAREAARYGATLPVEDSLADWLNDVADVAIGSASGELDATVPGQQVCVAYVYPLGSDANDVTTSIVETAGSRTIALGRPCFEDGRPDLERRVQVTVQRTTEVEAALFGDTITLDASAMVMYERND